MALLLRKNIENPIDDFCVFNFNDKKWVKADFAAHLGLTREQYDLFSKNQEDPRLPLFNIYKDNYHEKEFSSSAIRIGSL